MNNKKIIGDLGEDMVCKFLAKKGFDILQRNFMCRYGEIDIIADDGETLLFVEVKTRKSESLFLPRDAVTSSKRKKIIKTAYFYLMDYRGHSCPRFDVVEVYILPDGKVGKIEHLENAFTVE